MAKVVAAAWYVARGLAAYNVHGCLYIYIYISLSLSLCVLGLGTYRLVFREDLWDLGFQAFGLSPLRLLGWC